MLHHLTISHYALIEHLDIDFNSGFTVITGQTGAGKSIMLGALNLLLGGRADAKSIQSGEKSAPLKPHLTSRTSDLSPSLHATILTSMPLTASYGERFYSQAKAVLS